MEGNSKRAHATRAHMPGGRAMLPEPSRHFLAQKLCGFDILLSSEKNTKESGSAPRCKGLQE